MLKYRISCQCGLGGFKNSLPLKVKGGYITPIKKLTYDLMSMLIKNMWTFFITLIMQEKQMEKLMNQAVWGTESLTDH